MKLRAEQNDNIYCALEDIYDGLSIRGSARKWNVPESTLRYRENHRLNVHENNFRSRRLSELQEETLVNWILQEEEAGKPLTQRQIAKNATLLLGPEVQHQPLGHNWVSRFIKRHEHLKTKLTRGINASRSRQSNEEVLRPWYDKLDDTIKTLSVGPSRIYNMDETGMAEGTSRTGKVVGSDQSRASIAVTSDHTLWATGAECISANGHCLTPVVILSGESLQGQWLPSDGKLLPCAMTASPKGWMNAKIMMHWLKEVFLPETKPVIASLWRILLIDGAKSHVGIEFMKEARKQRVWVLYLPSHTSHLTQPLDVSVFGPLKHWFKEENAPFAHMSTTSPESKKRFLIHYRTAHNKSMTSSNIRTAFRKAGIYPTNVDRVLKQLPSIEPPRRQPARPLTPEKQPELEKPPYYTPHDRKDVMQQFTPLESEFQHVSRGMLTIAQKAGKALDKKNIEIADLKRQNEYLTYLADARMPHKRTKVQQDPNRVFADIHLMEEAREKANIGTQPSLENSMPTEEAEIAEMCALDTEDFDEALQ
jgi:DDE superfamily endonuclease/Tc5 transposase DNA-binding domain